MNELSVPSLCTHQGPRIQMSLHSPSVIKSSDVGKVQGIKYDVTDCKDRQVHLQEDQCCNVIILPTQGLPLELLQSDPVVKMLAQRYDEYCVFRCIDRRYGELFQGTEFTTSVRFLTNTDTADNTLPDTAHFALHTFRLDQISLDH